MTDQPAKLYDIGNPWQRKVYSKMAHYLKSIPEVNSCGVSTKGNSYQHLLPMELSAYNFVTPAIHEYALRVFENHKKGDRFRMFTNTAASQPYCFNLVVFLNQHKVLANKLFSNLLGKQVEVKHLEPEFIPNTCQVDGFERNADESIGDQGDGGTNADIVVFYTYDSNKKGILIIEFKFIEGEFSTCFSFSKKRYLRHFCTNPNFFDTMISQPMVYGKDKTPCGYKRYLNWELTQSSRVFDIKKISQNFGCPFRRGLNQLWRNLLLAEQVALTRNCNEFGLWVFSARENDEYLWKNGETENRFRNILNEKGNRRFKIFHLETILDKLRDMVNGEEEVCWLRDMERKYRIE